MSFIHPCVLYERECNGCGECDRCDLDPEKICDNCMRCVRGEADYRAIRIQQLLFNQDFGSADHPSK